MKKNFIGNRFIYITLIVGVLMIALCARLFVLTVVQEDKWAEAATSQNTKEVVIDAPRGQILDRYGRIIAGNKQVFTVEFNVSGLSTEQINESAYNMIKLFEANGDMYVDNFPIKLDEEGNFYYTYDVDKAKYIESLGLFSDASASTAFNLLRSKYNVDSSLSKYDALTYMQEEYGVWPPISARTMTWTYDSKKKSFLEKYGVCDLEKKAAGSLVYDVDAKEAFRQLRSIYSINPNLSDEEARKIFCVREEIKNAGYNKYQSSTIAEDVSEKTVAYLEEMSNSLKGIEISTKTVRTYPNGRLASHILGYMGSISDSQYTKYVTENGYNPDTLIGKDGIEATMETYLHGTDGKSSVLVNSNGDYIETLETIEPVKGSDVYLTIDMDLQRATEEALAKGVENTKTGGIFTSKFGNIKMTKYPNCTSGAAVVLDVETCETLAMASFPDYDPNIFADGISYAEWDSVQSTNPRDPLAAIPLYNNATKMSVQPGSTFKPITAVAALQAGLNPNKQIWDKGFIELGGRTFGCSIWNESRSVHGYETLITGIQNSCNYYFYCIATGQDWSNNKSLGYREDMSIEKIMSVAQQFGLGENTGIELYEETTALASAERKLQAMKSACYNQLYSHAIEYWPENIVENDEKLKKDINTIISWIEENPTRAELIKRVSAQTNVLEEEVEPLVDIVKYSYFNQASWGTGDVFNICIGQGDNAYTPIQMARYVATLGNNGLRNPVSIIKGIEGVDDIKIELDKEEPYQVDISESEMKTVLQGMRRVVTNGTLASVFNGFPIATAGKTGTAERDGYINPKDEVAYVKQHLAQIAPKLTWADVAKEMSNLMKSDPEKYPTENDAVDRAVIEATGRKITYNDINKYKDTYDSFAWTITLAPADNPKVAVVVLLTQGGTSYNAGIVAREIIGAYFDSNETKESAKQKTEMN